MSKRYPFKTAIGFLFNVHTKTIDDPKVYGKNATGGYGITIRLFPDDHHSLSTEVDSVIKMNIPWADNPKRPHKQLQTGDHEWKLITDFMPRVTYQGQLLADEVIPGSTGYCEGLIYTYSNHGGGVQLRLTKVVILQHYAKQPETDSTEALLKRFEDNRVRKPPASAEAQRAVTNPSSDLVECVRQPCITEYAGFKLLTKEELPPVPVLNEAFLKMKYRSAA